MRLVLAATLIFSSSFIAMPAGAQGTAVTPQKRASSNNAAIPGSAASAPTTKASAPKADRTAKSKECSIEADKRNLHGKLRKSFRSKCKNGQS